jgi:hypothetical protein
MPERLALLGQLRPTAANTAAAAYTVPTTTPPTQAVVSSVIVANTTGSDATFRLFATTGTTYDQSTALFYDVNVPGRGSAALSLGVTLAAGSKIGVSSGVASALTFTIFGQEVS